MRKNFFASKKGKQTTFAGIILIVIIVTSIVVISLPPTLDCSELGSQNIGTELFQVMVEGDLAFLSDHSDGNPQGVAIVNVSDPSNPELLSKYIEVGLPSRLWVEDDLLFVANRIAGLEILDISDPALPIRIGHYNPSGQIYDVMVEDELAYLASWTDGVEVLNVSDPSNPVQIGHYATSGAGIALIKDQHKLYVIDHGGSQSGLVILDASNPFLLTSLGSLWLPEVDFWIPVIDGDYIYVPDHGPNGGCVYVLDVSVPEAIRDVAKITACKNPSRVFIGEDHLVFIADSAFGLKVVDGTDPTSPQMLGRHSLDATRSAFDVFVEGSVVYIADNDFGLRIFQCIL